MTFRLARALTFATAMVASGGRGAEAQSAIVGAWAGEATVPGGNFSFRLQIARSDSGISAVVDIPESKLIQFTLPISRFEGGRLHVGVPAGWGLAMFRDIGLKPEEETFQFDGAMQGDSIVGALSVAFASFPLTLRRPTTSGVAYRREDVTFRNGEVVLAGTLYLPAGSGPFAVLEFTHGSGDQTRDAYAEEAGRLARAGIAALVYDKRGAGRSTGANWQVATFGELASDAAAGVEYLRHRPEIDTSRVGLFGLSQGTWLIGMAAERTGHVGFLVFASGSGIPVWEQDVYQTTATMRARGFSAAEVAEAESYERAKFDVSRTGLGWARLDSLSKALRARTKWFDRFAGDYPSLSNARFWWLAAYHYDPTATLERTTVPVLGLFGENDLSFPIPVVVARMRAALAKARNCDVTLRVFPGADHQIMVAQPYGGRTLRRQVTSEFVPTMIGWIQHHVVSVSASAGGKREPAAGSCSP